MHCNGVLLGWFLDQARRLLQDLSHHHEFSLDMFVTSNFDGRLTRVSPSVTRLLGYSREEFLARPFLEQSTRTTSSARCASVAQQERGEEIKRVRVDLCRALQQARAVCKHHSKGKSRG